MTCLLAALMLGSLTAVAAERQASAQHPTTAKAKKEKKPQKEKKAKKKSDAPPPDAVADDGAVDVPQIDAPPAGGPRFTWKQHPSVRIGSLFRMDFEAKFQEDAHGSYPNAPGLKCSGHALPTPCTWQLHRNRVGVQGNLFKHIEYEIERELTEQELTEKQILEGVTPKSQWKDVNVNFTYFKNAQIQIGKFKVPFGLDQLTGVTHNDFVYRSLGANALAPARDIGAMAHGSFLKRGFRYWTGVFQHDGDNARSKKIAGGDVTVAARVTGTPFRPITVPALGNIELGGAFALTKLSDDSFRPNGLRGRTILTQDTFFEPVYVKGHRRRWEGDVDWTVGRASARAEYTLVSDDRLKQGLGDQDLPPARARSWYVSGTWVVTGEPKKRPLRAANEFLTGGGAGAVELAARYERLWFDSAGGADVASRGTRAETIRSSGDRALTLGVNWTLNRFIKIQINGIREQVEDVERSPVPNSVAFWSRVLRLQFVL